jgi:hypothetical protein
LAACTAPRQVVLQAVPVEIRDTILVERPIYRDTGSVIIVPAGNYDSLFFEWEKIWTEVVMEQDTVTRTRVYRVTSGTKPDTVFIEVVLRDTLELEKECPALPAMPSGGGFPWGALLLFIGLLTVWWAGKTRKKR